MKKTLRYFALVISLTMLLSAAIPAMALATEGPFEPPNDDSAEDGVFHITDAELPLIPGPGGSSGSWALWNLILSIAGVVIAIMMGTRLVMKNKSEDEEDEDQILESRTKSLLAVLIPVLALTAVVMFTLTQDMRHPMIMVDYWTLAHGALFAGGFFSYIFANKSIEDEEESVIA
jgi:hypothetical protein